MRNTQHELLNREYLKKFSSLIITLIAYTGISIAGPKVPINGFCVLSEPSLPASYQSIIPIEFSQDAYTDVLVYTPGSKIISTFFSSPQLSFTPAFNGAIIHEIRNLVVLPVAKKKNAYFAGVSRSGKSVFTFYLSKWGTPKNFQSLILDSYPEGISASDCDGDGVSEIMVFGPSFQGIRVIKPFEKFKVIWKENNGVFSHAVFTDLNHDGYDDIAAYELRSGKINFFFNNSRGEFRFTRTFRTRGIPEQLAGIDFNADGYNDVLIRSGSTLEVFIGDSITSYNQSRIINLKELSKFIYGDFNRDGKFDIASLNKISGGITIFFQHKDFEFYDGLNYFSDKSFADIKPFYSKFINGILTTGSGGTKVIHNFRSLFEKKPFIFPLIPIKVKTLDINRDKIDDLCLLDSSGTFVDIIQRGRNGIPQFIHRISTGVRITDFINYTIDRNEQRLVMQVALSPELLICNLDSDQTNNKFSSSFFERQILSISSISLVTDEVSMPVIFLRSETGINIILPGRRESSEKIVLPYTLGIDERFILSGSDVVSASLFPGRGIKLKSFRFTSQLVTENYISDQNTDRVLAIYPWESSLNSFLVFVENRGKILAYFGNISGNFVPLEIIGEGKEVFSNSNVYFSLSVEGAPFHYIYSHKTSRIYRLTLIKKKKSLICFPVSSFHKIIDFTVTRSTGNIPYILSIDGESPKILVNRG